MAVDGDVMVVGTAFANDSVPREDGRVRVFRRRDGIWQEDAQELLPSPVEADRYFGTNVALADGRLFVSSRTAIYVFRDVSGDGGPGGWQLEAELVPSNPDGARMSPRAFDTDGSRVIVGMSDFSAYVFSRNGDEWREEAKLSVADHIEVLSSISPIVSIDGDVAVMSALLDNDHGQSVHVFEQVDGAWSYQQQISLDDSYDYIWSVALDGDTLAIAIDGESVVDVYERGVDGWQRTAKLIPGETPHGLLGAVLVIRGDTMVVSQPAEPPWPGDTIPGGTVTVFQRDEAGWRKQAVLTSPDSKVLDAFGYHLASDGQSIVVTANNHSGARSTTAPYEIVEDPLPPSLHVFRFDDQFIEELPPEEPPAPDPPPPETPPEEPPTPDPPPSEPVTLIPGDEIVPSVNFGPWDLDYLETIDDAKRSPVAVDGDVMVVGRGADAFSGVRVFRRVDGRWHQESQELRNPVDPTDDSFGENVALAAGRLFVSSDTAIYVFRDGGLGDWQLEAELVPEGVNGARMSSRPFSTDGNRLIVGMSDFTAYVFSRDGDQWREEAALSVADHLDQAPNSTAFVAIDGGVAVVFSQFAGGRGDSAYVFEQIDGVWVYRQQLSADSSQNFMSVAIEGDTLAIVIDDENVVDVYERGADTWRRTAKLRIGHVLLGATVVIHDDTLILSQILDPMTPGGSVTIYQRDGDGWREQTVLTAPESQPLDGFGVTLATDGETIVVRSVDVWAIREGEPLPSRLYVFGFNEAFIEELPPEQPPTPDPLPPEAVPEEPVVPPPEQPPTPDPPPSEPVPEEPSIPDPPPEQPPVLDPPFGVGSWQLEYSQTIKSLKNSPVAIDGDVMVVGGPDVRGGRLRILRRIDGRWQYEVSVNIGFARHVALADGRLFVATNSEVRVSRDGGPGQWELEATLSVDQPLSRYGFDTDGSRVIFGGKNSVTIFSRDGDQWREEATLPAVPGFTPDGRQGYVHDPQVSIYGDTAVISVKYGRNALFSSAGYTGVLVFQRTDGIWVQKQRILLDRTTGPDTISSLDLSGDTLAIAIEGENVVDVYQRGVDRWLRTTKLRTGDTPHSLLNATVVIQGNMMVLSQSLEPPFAKSKIAGGSVTVFQRDETGWSEQAVFAAPESQILDGFGMSLATDGRTIVATAVDP
ncbi:MAG: hypothetical protein IIA44_05355, partial [Acidobacteria bacterium]|nr:hypothetical protein [Acidobacteriota bacterium]